MNETPLGNVNQAHFLDLVVERNVRPERPDEDDGPQVPDTIWELAERCWVKDPKNRPTARTVCDTLSQILNNSGDIERPVVAPSPPQPIIMPSSAPSLHVQVKPSPARPPTPHTLTLRGQKSSARCAAFSPDGKYIVSGYEDSTIMLWDSTTGNVALGPLNMHTDRVWCVAFSPNGREIASGSGDNTILVWDAATGEMLVGPFRGHTNTVVSVAFSPEGKQIASGAMDNTIRIWDAQTGDLLVGPLTGHTHWVYSVSFSPGSRQLVSGSGDKTVRIWGVESGDLIHGPLDGHRAAVYSVAFSPDGRRIISAEWGGDVCVWNTTTGALLSGPSKQHGTKTLAAVSASSSTRYCAVSPDGKWIAGHKDRHLNIIEVWDSNMGQCVATYSERHRDYVYSISFSPDSGRILTASNDNTIGVHRLMFHAMNRISI